MHSYIRSIHANANANVMTVKDMFLFMIFSIRTTVVCVNTKNPSFLYLDQIKERGGGNRPSLHIEGFPIGYNSCNMSHRN